MGLDMYAYITRVKLEPVGSVQTLLPGVWETMEEIARWRKHPDLHGWMERLYRCRGGEGDFNLDYVLLSLADLEQLERDVKRKRLPKTTGFFFGESSPEDREDDEAFIAKARDALSKDYQVLYMSWW